MAQTPAAEPSAVPAEQEPPPPVPSIRPRAEAVADWTGDPRIDSGDLATLVEDVRHLQQRHGRAYRRLLRDVFHRVRAATADRPQFDLLDHFPAEGPRAPRRSGQYVRLPLLERAYIAPGGLSFDLEAKIMLFAQPLGCGHHEVMSLSTVELVAEPPRGTRMALAPEDFEAGSLLRTIVADSEARRIARSFKYLRFVRVSYFFRHTRWSPFGSPWIEARIAFDADPEAKIAGIRIGVETRSRLDHDATRDFRRRRPRDDTPLADRWDSTEVTHDEGWWAGTPEQIRANQERLGWTPRRRRIRTGR